MRSGPVVTRYHNGRKPRDRRFTDSLHAKFINFEPNPPTVTTRKRNGYVYIQNKEGKEKWRNWCEQYKERVQDYNFGTLLRLDPTDDYTEKNSCFALRVQFLAIEIARNKEGKNQKIFEAAKAAKEAAAKSGGGCCSKC